MSRPEPSTDPRPSGDDDAAEGGGAPAEAAGRPPGPEAPDGPEALDALDGPDHVAAGEGGGPWPTAGRSSGAAARVAGGVGRPPAPGAAPPPATSPEAYAGGAAAVPEGPWPKAGRHGEAHDVDFGGGAPAPDGAVDPADVPTGDAWPAVTPAGEGAPDAGAPDEAPPPTAERRPCPTCGEPLTAGARFCEACGGPADAGAGGGPAAGADVPTGPMPGPPAGQLPPCVRCGGEVAPDGYCTMCGHRAIEPVDVQDGGDLAYATHRGRRHERNEDSGALAVTAEGWPVLVVSDGVSASPNPQHASAAAVAAATERLGGRPFAGPDDLADAVAEAHLAASAIPASGDEHWPEDGTHPACTIVVAVVTPDVVHMANVGDARGHVLRPDGDAWAVTQLTTDDSVAARAVAEGVDLETALSLPGGHAITGWLGADAPTPDPHLVVHPVAGDEVVLVDSDGLWNYAATDEALAALVTSELGTPAEWPAAPLGALCERLVSWAVGQGGVDNVTAALAPVPPGGTAAADDDQNQREEPA